jgi:hypothetical protein
MGIADVYDQWEPGFTQSTQTVADICNCLTILCEPGFPDLSPIVYIKIWHMSATVCDCLTILCEPGLTNVSVQ